MALAGGVSDDDPLCCCEYVNAKGERSHLLGLLCDCSEVDDAVDRFFKGLAIPSARSDEILVVVEDRLRMPWRGGARKVRLDVVLPWILVPLNIWVSSQNLLCLLLVHGVLLPLSICATYRFCLRGSRPQTKFFASWSVATTACLFLIYEHQLVGVANLPKIISPWENLCLIGFLLAAVQAAHTVRSRPHSRSEAGAKYCKVCKAYVPGKDHHCVWLDACISSSNFYPFVALLVCAFSASLHGGLLFLTSVCDSVAELELWPGGGLAVLLPTGCRAFNQRFEGNPDLAFAAGVHCMCISVPLLMLLIQKLHAAFKTRLKRSPERGQTKS